MRRWILALAGVLVSWMAVAQSGNVKATIWDKEAKAGLPGAVIEVTSVANPSKKLHYTSGYNGVVTINNLKYGDYTLSASFLGYETATVNFTLNNVNLNIGQVAMNPSAHQIEAVVKEVQALRTSQKGDTLSYNAAAFKVSADADVEGLLKKMTGITITDGAVEVQGEEVKKIFVDGKEFFGEDVTTAIKSLPAEAVDRIEVFNKLSDQAEFSGMDDGEGYKALNIVTHTNMRQGQFGKFYAGGGYDFEQDEFRYLVGGNVNIFNGDGRLSVIALFNDVNQQNFSFEDILGVNGGGGGGRGRGAGAYMVRPQPGVATVNAVGLNYSDVWGKRDQVNFQGSYFFNHSNTVNHSSRERWSEFYTTIDDEQLLQRDTLTEVGNSETANMNHRFNARLDWKISDNQSLMSRTWISYQSNDPMSLKEGYQWGQSGYSQLYDESRSNYGGFNVSEFLQYRAKLGKAGRTITLDGNVRYSDSERSSDAWANQAEAAPYDPSQLPPYPYPPLDLLYQRITSPTSSLDLRGNFTYTEPLSKFSQFSLQYRFSYEDDESDRRSYTDGDQLNPSLSNTHSSTYTSHQVGPGFRWAKERNTFVANVYYQRSMLDGQTVYPNQSTLKHNYNHFTYFLMLNMQFNPQNSIRLFVNSRTQEPSVTNLQDVYNLANPQYISGGNSNLNPSYSHNVRFHYVNSNITKGRTFMWMAMVSNTSDYIATNVEYGKEILVDDVVYRPLQYSSPVNMDGYWSLRTHVSYGLPLNFMKCNLNMMAGVNYSLVPSQINSERNDASNMGYDANFTLGSNISENVDFTISWHGFYNVAKNSLEVLADAGNNEYFNHTASANLKWTFWKGFTLTASAAYSQYRGITNDYNEDYMLCNLYLGKKFLKNQRAEVQIGVNDLLNQNKAFSRTTGSGWVQNATNSVIGRYYMVNLVFNLRHFGKKGSTNISDYEGMGGTRGGMRMGPPPGGHRF